MLFKANLHTLSMVIVFSFFVTNLFGQGQFGQGQNPGFRQGALRVADNSRTVANQVGRPFPPLSAEHQKYLDQILRYWEFSSSKIKRYRCDFTRLEYDPVFGPKKWYKTKSEGAIKYSTPDKGLFHVKKIEYYTSPAKPGEEPKYLPRPGDVDEKWICDGKTIFEFDHQNKRLIERQLPPEMQGKAIMDGPLPFLFGAKAKEIKQRYWIRVITPPKVKDEYWLEAFPKTRQDAANFKKIEIIIAQKDFLPKAIQIFDRNYDPRTNQTRTVLEFKNREVNWLKINPKEWITNFYKPATPKGWTRHKEAFQAGPAAATRRGNRAAAQAQLRRLPVIPR